MQQQAAAAELLPNLNAGVGHDRLLQGVQPQLTPRRQSTRALLHMQAQQGQALQGSEFLVLDQVTPQPPPQQQRESAAEQAPPSVWAASPPQHRPMQLHQRPPHAPVPPPLPLPPPEEAQPQQGGMRISVSNGSASGALTAGCTGRLRHTQGSLDGSLPDCTCPWLPLLVEGCIEMQRPPSPARQLCQICLSPGRLHCTWQVCRQCGQTSSPWCPLQTSGLWCPLQTPMTVTELEDQMRQQSLGAPGGSAAGPRGAAAGVPPPAPPPGPPVRLPPWFAQSHTLSFKHVNRELNFNGTFFIMLNLNHL